MRLFRDAIHYIKNVGATVVQWLANTKSLKTAKQRLPFLEEAFYHILQKLPLASLGALASVSKAANQATRNKKIWQNLLVRDFPFAAIEKLTAFKETPDVLFKEQIKSIKWAVKNGTPASILSALHANDHALALVEPDFESTFYIIGVANGHFQYINKLDQYHLVCSLYVAFKLYHVDSVYHIWNLLTIEQQKNLAYSFLIFAIKTNHFPLIRFFKEQDHRFFKIPRPTNDQTLMRCAVSANNGEILKYLLFLRPVISNWRSLIELAYKTKNPEIVALIKHYKHHQNHPTWTKLVSSSVLRTAKNLSSHVPHILTLIQLDHLNKNETLLASYLNANQCLLKDKAIWENGFPQAVIVHAAPTSLRDIIVDWIFSLTFSTKFHLGDLAKYFSIHYKAVSFITEICHLIKTAKQLGPVKFLMIRGHGNSEELFLGEDTLDQRISARDYFFNHPKSPIHELTCLNELANPATIVLESCETAGNHTINIIKNRSFMSFEFNLQKLFALHAPGSTVLAPDFLVQGSSTSIRFSPNLEAYGFGFYSDSLTNFFSRSTYMFLPLFSPAHTLYSAYTPEFLLNKYTTITPKNAKFCEKVLPYFLMKPYCDASFFRPSPSAIAACFADKACHLQAHLLSNKGNSQSINNTLTLETSTHPQPQFSSEPFFLYHALTSTLSAFTSSVVKQHCQYKGYSKGKTLLFTCATRLATQIAIAPKSPSSFTSLGLSSLTYYGYRTTYLSYGMCALQGGYYLYKCYKYPDQLATTLVEIATITGGTLIGNKLGEYAYDLYLRKRPK